MGGDQVDVLSQLWMVLPDVPLLRGGHRHLDCRAYAVDVGNQVFRGHFAAEQRFVTDHHAHYAA